MSTPTATGSSTALAERKTPYQLDLTQTTQACKVLLKHITDERRRRDAEREKPNLLSGAGDDTDGEGRDSPSSDEQDPVWLILTTKKHIVDQKRLKPSKIPLPHSINTSTASSICLITADPQSTYTSLVAHPSFPAPLRARVTKVLSLSNLKKTYSSFESRRQLLATHDVFLADDRIVTYLPGLLGKVFYKGGSKRPIPVNIAEPRKDEAGKRIKLDPATARKSKDKVQGGRGSAPPESVGREIERALGSALVHLAPGTSTAVKLGRSGMPVESVAANVDAVVQGLVDRFVTQGWRNVRAIHVKGPNTMAFPIWLADELWVDEDDVLEEKKTFGNKNKSKNNTPRLDGAAEKIKPLAADRDSSDGEASNKKRKAAETKKPSTAKHVKKKRRLDAERAEQAALAKESLREQKAAVMAAVS